MKILILHRIPYHKVHYHLGIDHDRHDVTYVGTRNSLGDLPEMLRCIRLERPATGNVADEVIALTRHHRLRFDRVISLSEYELLDAARVREALGVEGPTIADVLKVRDKMVMKHLVSRRGVRVPQAMPLGALLDGNAVGWRGTTVVKPVDGASSEDVRVFARPAAVREACRSGDSGIEALDGAERARALPRFEVEEFIEGPILHFDGLVIDGHVRIVRGSRYVGTCLAYAEGQPLGSVQFPMNAGDKAWVQTVIDAIGIARGSFHLEAIEDSASPGAPKVFLEIANRVGGADVVDSFEMATGVHLPAAELRILIGETPCLEAPPDSDLHYGWFVFPGHHLPPGGCLVMGSEPFTSHPFMIRCNRLAEGAPLPRSITYQAREVPFAGIVAGRCADELSAWLRRMFTCVTVDVAESAFSGVSP